MPRFLKTLRINAVCAILGAALALAPAAHAMRSNSVGFGFYGGGGRVHSGVGGFHSAMGGRGRMGFGGGMVSRHDGNWRSGMHASWRGGMHAAWRHGFRRGRQVNLAWVTYYGYAYGGYCDPDSPWFDPNYCYGYGYGY